MGAFLEKCLSFPCVPEEMCGRDSDALFAYTTTKLVRIQDRRLGIIKYAFWIAIFVYIAGIQLGYYRDPRPSGDGSDS